LPETLIENIAKKNQNVVNGVKQNNLENVQDLLDIKQEVMMLRKANDAL